MKKNLFIVGLILIAAGGAALIYAFRSVEPVGESQPTTGKEHLIRVSAPEPNERVESPLTVQGEARGTWFFEASFPARLLDGSGKEIAVAPAQAEGEWMTEEFVPFRAVLEFGSPETYEGILVLEKDNPSGLPEHADEVRVPVLFARDGIPEKPKFEVIAQNLAIPWEIAFLAEGELLVTERPGRLLKIGKDRTIIPIEGVRHAGEGGLLGMALHPRFSENRWLYLYLTAAAGDGLVNRVERYRLKDNQLSERTIIIDDIPGAAYHDGGRIAFGPSFAPAGASEGAPDYYLYITTGDATRSDLAQDKESLAGKILRLKDDGSIPPDNPFHNAVWSYGHRNSQGLAWDDKGRLWATEHGRSGLLSGLDELNLIEKGKNYGWPKIQGNEQRESMRRAVINSGPKETWAPASAVFYNGRVFFTGLRGETLYEAIITSEGKVASLKKHFVKQFGRLRALALGPDGFFYLSTSNTDGRGEPNAGDDKIIRIRPDAFVPK